MNEPTSFTAPHARSPWRFFLLVFALSMPLSLAGTLIKVEVVPGLPLSALVVTYCPLIAAVILVYRENKVAGVIDLLKRAVDYKRIKSKVWLLPAIVLMPIVMVIEYIILRGLGVPVPAPHFSLLTLAGLLLAFFVFAFGEELGWMGYAFDPLQARSNALRASLLLGAVGAVWHFIPLFQVGRSANWIVWWSVATVAHRVITVWLYNNTGRSIFVTAIYHALGNLTWQLFPVDGSYYDPAITGLLLTSVAVVIVAVWGSKTLA